MDKTFLIMLLCITLSIAVVAGILILSYWNVLFDILKEILGVKNE